MEKIMSDVNITRSAFVFGGKRYFRVGSEDLELVSFGQKKTPLTQANYLAKEGTVSTGNLSRVKVDISGPFTIEWSKYGSSDVNAGISYLKLVGGKGAFNHNVAKNAHLKLVKFGLGETPLKNLLNKHANAARSALDEEGNDGRIVSAVWVVMEAELASQVSSAGSVNVSVPIANSGFVVDLGGGGSSTSNSKVTIPPGTTFAYLLHKVKQWEKSNGKRLVKNMEDDQQSLN
jgi:hypothetical protein